MSARISSKLLCFVLSVLLFLLSCPAAVEAKSLNDTGVSATVFRDVSPEHWFYDYVRIVSERGLMIGKSEDEFYPDAMITGAETLTLLSRVYAILEGDEAALLSQTEGSVPWYSGYLSYCVKKGLLTQAERNALSPDEPLSRDEVVFYFSRLPDRIWTVINSIPDGSIPDVPMTSPYAEAIYRAYRSGVVIGTDAKGTFLPNEPIKRSEIAALTVRLLDASQRLSLTLTVSGSVVLYAADGSRKRVSSSLLSRYLDEGWKTSPWQTSPSFTTLLNTATLTPTKTGYAPLDQMVDRVFASLFTSSMSNAEKVQACYDYLIRTMTYGKSPVSGKYRSLYHSNPYSDPCPGLSVPSSGAMAGDRGYTYFYQALKAHALEGYAALYAAEALDGKRGLCDHYSSAFAIMMQRLGYSCFPIYVRAKNGSAFQPHMLTILTVGGVDFIMDPQIEQVLTNSTGSNQHKRFGKTIAELSDQYLSFDHLEDGRLLFGTFSYTAQSMSQVES